MKRFALPILLGLGLCAQTPTDAYKTREAKVLAWEKNLEAVQPPAVVMDAMGLRPGMVIGEVGAGLGRFTVHFARRVGPTGRVYANDILPESLAFLRQRALVQGLPQIEAVLGTETDPHFPRKDLDLVGMVWTYHMMEQPVAMLRSLVPYLKAGGRVVMVEPVPSDIEDEIEERVKRTGKRPSDIHVVSRATVAREAVEAGLTLEKVVEEALKKDVIYILRKS